MFMGPSGKRLGPSGFGSRILLPLEKDQGPSKESLASADKRMLTHC